MHKALREIVNDQAHQGPTFPVNQSDDKGLPRMPRPSPVPASRELSIIDAFVREGEIFYSLLHRVKCDRVGTEDAFTDSWSRILRVNMIAKEVD